MFARKNAPVRFAATLACLSLTTAWTTTTAWAKIEGTGQDVQIIGGSEVTAESPVASSTVAVLAAVGEGLSICTGSLLDNDLVVTAAHCIDPSADKLVVSFRRDITGEGLVVPVKAVVVHPGYAEHANTNVDNDDIALIRIDTQLPSGFAPAELLEDASALEVGRQVTLAGFGTTTGDPTATESGSGKLRETKIKISDPNFGATEVLLDQTHGKGACHGDSGGPAFVKVRGKLKLFGVTSRGEGGEKAAECGESVVYTNILAQMNFLNKAAKVLRSVR